MFFDTITDDKHFSWNKFAGFFSFLALLTSGYYLFHQDWLSMAIWAIVALFIFLLIPKKDEHGENRYSGWQVGLIILIFGCGTIFMLNILY